MAYSISAGLTAALTADIQTPISKVEVLDAASRSVIATVTDIDDGSVTVDVGRGTRRTFQLRLSNENGKYTPTTALDYFAFNRLIRIHRGLRYWDATAGTTVDEYVVVGTFMIDRPEVFVERNMSVLTVDGSDLWKKIATGGFASGNSFAVGTHINTVIAAVATASGIPVSQLSLDPLTGVPDANKLLGSTLAWEPGDNRSDFLTNTASQFALDVYFDPYGTLVSRQVVDPTKQSEVWSFSPGESSVMLGVTRIQNDLRLINHVIVTGENTSTTAVRYEIVDDKPESPTYTGTIGDRVMVVKSPLATTVDQAKAIAIKTYKENALIDEEIKLPTMCLPHLEGNDVIAITEGTWAKVGSQKYLLQRFEIPLRDSRMTIETKKAREIPT